MHSSSSEGESVHVAQPVPVGGEGALSEVEVSSNESNSLETVDISALEAQIREIIARNAGMEVGEDVKKLEKEEVKEDASGSIKHPDSQTPAFKVGKKVDVTLKAGTEAGEEVKRPKEKEEARESVALPDSWAAAFEVKGGVDEIESIEILKSVPFQNRWDANRGVYRPMPNLEALEMEVLTALDDVVLWSRAVGEASEGQAAQKLSATGINYVNLFMRFVSALQTLIDRYDPLLQEVEYLETEQAAFALGVVRYAEEIKSERNKKSAAELRLERHIVDLKVTLEDVAKELEGERLRLKSMYADVKKERREALRDAHESSLLAIAEELSAKLGDMTEKKMIQLETLFFNAENASYAFETDSLEKDGEAQLRAIESTLELALNAIRFKAEAESEIENENIDIHLNMIEAKGRARIKGFESIVTKVFEEIVSRAYKLVEEPMVLVKASVVFLVFFIVLLLAYEAGIIVRQGIVAFFSSRKILNEHSRGDGSAFSEFTGITDILLEPVCHDKLRAFMHQLRRAAEQGLALPNLLVSGPPGVGKTMAAAVATLENSDEHPGESLPPVAVICGGDLLALDGGASAYLRRVLDGAIAGRRCLVVLDGFDDIVARRDGSEHSSHHDTLCTLLYSLRVNSPHLAVIITTSLQHSEVDDAVLDRMDSILKLTMPAPCIRAVIVKRYCRTHLYGFLDVEARTWLDEESDKLLHDEDALSLAIDEVCGPENTSPRHAGKPRSKQAKTKAKTGVSGSGLNIRTCLLETVGATKGLSHREVGKVMKSVHNGVLATESFRLDNETWLKNIRPKDVDIDGFVRQ